MPKQVVPTTLRLSYKSTSSRIDFSDVFGMLSRNAGETYQGISNYEMFGGDFHPGPKYTTFSGLPTRKTSIPLSLTLDSTLSTAVWVYDVSRMDFPC
jgi:hypothetical protein